jgi:hypothetical protein
MSQRSWPRPASRRIWPSRPTPRSPAPASGTPRPIRPTAGTCGCCWPRAGCRSAGSRPGTSWNAGRYWRPTMTCGPSTPPGCSASTATGVLSSSSCREHGVGPVRQPALPHHPNRLGHLLADSFPDPQRCDRERDKHNPLLSSRHVPRRCVPRGTCRRPPVPRRQSDVRVSDVRLSDVHVHDLVVPASRRPRIRA